MGDLFILDLNIYRNVLALIESFISFVEAFEKINEYLYFDISYSSFAYDSSTQRYVFIDIDKLENGKNIKKHLSTVKREMTWRFLKPFNDEAYALSYSELQKLNHFSTYLNQFPDNLVIYDDLRTITFVRNNNNEEKSQENTSTSTLTLTSSSTLTINIKDEESHFDLKVLHDGKPIVFNRIRKEDTFIIYVCQEKSNQYDIQCSNADIQDISSPVSKSIPIPKDKRIDIEVQESFAKTNDLIEDKSQALYEIFIMVRPKDAPGLTQSQTFNTLNIPLELQENDLILCETITNKLIIYYNLSTDSSRKIYPMNSKDLQILNSKEIIQISPYQLDNQIFIYPEQVKRVFYLSQVANKSIFILNESFEYLKLISIENFEVKPEPFILRECTNEVSSLFFSAVPNNMEIEYNSSKKKYPSPIIFVESFKSSFEMKYTCFKKRSENLSILGLNQIFEPYRSFQWNFNSHSNPETINSKQNIVYLFDKDSIDNSVFPFKDFAWPTPNKYDVFISILKEKSDSFITRAFFFKEDRELYNIIGEKENETQLITSTVPKNLNYEKVVSLSLNNRDKLSFDTHDAVYLSGDEVVYQINIENFQNCRPTIKFRENDTLKIDCSSWMSKVSSRKVSIDDPLSNGIKRIASQVKPYLTKQSGTNSPNLKNTKEAQVLV